MMETDCKIVPDFPRPALALVERFRGMASSTVADTIKTPAVFDGALAPIGQGQLLGTALTVRVPQGDNLMVHAAIELAQPGDVLVIDADGFMDRAMLGELMANYCKTRGIRGVVCDGAIRDRDALAQLKDFPVYARGTTPNGPTRNGPGEIGIPIVVGGRTVHPGDILVGDEDGVVAIPLAVAEQVADAALRVKEKEEMLLRAILKEGVFDRPWLDAQLKRLGCDSASSRVCP